MSIIQKGQEQTLSLADIEMAKKFPTGFAWGAATAAYQVEGATSEDGRGSSMWDDFAATPGKTYQGDNGLVAADHYHRVEEDTDLMVQLGLDAYRFSIAWPRILPQGRGEVNIAGLDFYDRLVDTLLQKGISPFATLYHWDLPSPLQQTGGWVNRDTSFAFADYAELVVRRLGDRVAGWITLNEPWCSAYLGYGVGVHAPGIQDRQAMVDAAHHLLLAHGLAIPRIKAHIVPEAQVGITLLLSPAYPADDRPETQRDVKLSHDFSNGWFLDPILRGHYPDKLFTNLGVVEPPIQEGDLDIISTPMDFLGINNYSRVLVHGSETQPLADACVGVAPIPEACYTDMAWEIYPQGLRDLLIHVHQEYALPRIYVTENGAAFKDVIDSDGQVRDPRRVDYLRSYLSGLTEAIEQGVPLKGYFAWSLIDNFEWSEGYNKRFGLVYVDYPTQQRIIKESGHWYTALLAACHSIV